MRVSQGGLRYYVFRPNMKLTRCVSAIVVLLASSVTLTFADHKGDDAGNLVRHANSLSDIRQDGASSFVLKADLKLANDNGSTVEATKQPTPNSGSRTPNGAKNWPWGIFGGFRLQWGGTIGCLIAQAIFPINSPNSELRFSCRLHGTVGK